MTPMHAYRTHNCGQLRASNVGETVRLSGWVHRKRDHGHLLFVDLRDHYGITQIVTDIDAAAFAALDRVRLESVLTIEGDVVARSPETENPNLATGEIEVRAREVIVQSAAAELPMPVAGEQDYPEDIRLKYRYLDLRREQPHRNIMLRSAVIASIRRRMIEQGFTEFQTPILTASSPEGARDYLVPSRVHPGKFYALPQAPQMFKQLIMVAGFDRYFQIAPCFRDEDARADRSPGEFYQLDFEMSFVTQDDVFAAIEPVLSGVFEEFAEGRTVTPAGEYPRIPYKDALLKYGTDKPDLRNPLLIADVGEEGMNRLVEQIGLGADDGIFFAAGKEEEAARLAGAARTRIAEQLNLIEQGAFRFCWIVDFPMYEYNEDQKKIDFSHNPFSMPQGEMGALETKDPLDILAWQYDIVCNGVELSSGAIRNHRPDIMYKACEIAGYSREEVDTNFSGMINAFKYGAPPHGGSAPGIDRIVMLLADEPNIREVILFPMNQKAEDLMMNAPAEVMPKQLKELHIRIVEPS